MNRVHKSDPVVFSDGSYEPPFTTSAIFVGTAVGDTIVARLRGDPDPAPWTVYSGQYLLGDFAEIIEAGTEATNLIAVTDCTE